MRYEQYKELLHGVCEADSICDDDHLFGNVLGISSVAFLEFVMHLEEDSGLEIDLDRIDYSTVTVRQFFDLCFGKAE